MLTGKQSWQPPFHYDPTTGRIYDANLTRVCTLMPYNDNLNAIVAEALNAHFQEKRLDGPKQPENTATCAYCGEKRVCHNEGLK